MSSHRVCLRPSGRRFDVQAGETVLAAALRASVVLPYGCKNGACGACRGRLLAGAVRHCEHTEAALSAADEAAGGVLLCCAYPLADAQIEVRGVVGGSLPAPRRLPCRIERIERPAPDVAILTLTLPPAQALQWGAGQYLDVLLKDGTRRSYSIATAPEEAGAPLQLHVRHMPGGRFTDTLFGAAPTLKERDLLRIEVPLGTFQLRVQDVRPIVLLAGGTGFAPIKAIAETLFHLGTNRDEPELGRLGTPVAIYWGVRGRGDLYMDELPRRWAREQPNVRYVPVLSEPVPQDRWDGRTGLVHRALMADLPDLSAHQVYACGTPAMIEAARRDLVGDCGLPPEQFLADAFTSAADLPRR